MDDVHGAVERVVRESYGRLVAYLSARTRDVAGAEDALSDAFAAALRTWPVDGVPGSPEAWLLTAARRRLIDRARYQRTRIVAAAALRHALRQGASAAVSDFPDDRLKLLFVCAHPEIDRNVHTALMLQVVLGLDAARIAAAFLTSPSAMGQRLSRAKARIQDANLAFQIPECSELPARLGAVLDAIYAAYGSGWDDVDGTDARTRGLAEEAVWLARVLLQLSPGEPEAQGLLALMLYCEARRGARRAGGQYVPMTEQDVSRWDSALITEAEALLSEAGRHGRPGRFQLEAALQSAHVEGRRCGRTDWPAIAVLYEGLVREWPSIGALVGRAAALARVAGAESGLSALDAIARPSADLYQPYWAVRADLLARLGRRPEAVAAYDRAIGLSEDPALRRFLLARRAAWAAQAS
jgi:RNA polymerase sigma-70 factor (ECF subfamily)